MAYSVPHLLRCYEYFTIAVIHVRQLNVLIIMVCISRGFRGISVFAICGSMFIALAFVFVVVVVVETVFGAHTPV